jgi:hypothetical protein
LFNQPAPSRSAKPWQPNARLVLDATGRGFASTQWTQQEGPEFAQGGFQPHATGFTQDRYQAVSMPLSEKSKTTLRLMGEAEESDGFATDEMKRREPASPNAHLPFVLDVYGVKPVAAEVAQATDVMDTDAIDAQVQEAGAHEEDADTLDAEAVDAAHAAVEATEIQEIDDTQPEAMQAETAEDGVSELEADAAEDEPSDTERADVDVDVDADADADQDADLHAESALDDAPEPDLAESELITDDSAGEPQDLAAEIDDVLAQEPVPVATPVLVGIDPEEVAQREAAHFAQGLAQGIEQGERQAREAMQQEVAAQCAVLSAVSHDLNALLQDPKKFFEPLKRLALHVAEHVVMKELSTSTEAIERLVQRCLDELDHPAKGAVVVELNPQDKERLQAQGSALVAGMRLDAVQGMKPGSVRLLPTTRWWKTWSNTA